MMTCKLRYASRRAALPILCLFAFALGLWLSPAWGDTGPGDWGMFQHDAQHTGRSAFTGPATPVQHWAFSDWSDNYSCPSFRADGTQQWAFPTGALVESSPAIGAGGTIYLGASAFLYAIGGPVPTALTLTTSPASPQPPNTQIAITASASGLSLVSYRFWLYHPAATPAWSQLQAYSPQATCPWTPSAPGSYLISVTAQDGPGGIEKNTTLWYTVQ